MERPPVFIGSSTEGKRVAKAVYRLLTDWAEPKLWTQGIFLPGRFAFEELERSVRRCRFALFVATPDDEVTKRGETSLVMRDNVLFEFGLFAGILGRRRVFLFVPDTPRIDVPTDLLGLTLATYDLARARRDDDSEVVAAVQNGVDAIESAVKEDWRMTRIEEEHRKRRMQASARGQSITRLFGVATRLYDAMWTLQRESIQTLIAEQTFDSLRATAIDAVNSTAESYRADAEIAGASDELDMLTKAIVAAIGSVPDPRAMVSQGDAVKVAKAIAIDAAWSYLRGGDIAHTVRSSATRKGKPQYEALALAYAEWWRVTGPPLEKATKAMNDALTRASIELGVEAARTEAVESL